MRFSLPQLCELHFRAIERRDAEMLLEWRNHPGVREAMLSSHVIGIDEHLAWFERILAQDSLTHFVLELRNEPIGTVGFAKLDKDSRRAEWTFHIRPYDAPAGMGSIMGFLALDHFFSVMGMNKLVGEVLASNGRSLNLHRKLGFNEEGIRRAHVRKNGLLQDIYEFAFFSEMWKQKREELCQKLFEAREMKQGKIEL